MPSVSFDRAADVYDETRALPPQIAPRLTEALLAELGRAGAPRLLETGIGTGRIARPLAARGVRVTGVDIAQRMIERLRAQLDASHTPPDLALADAAALPFRDGSFRAALLVHVLHLVASWQGTLDELRRVVAPGGVVIHHQTRYLGDNPFTPGIDKWNELLAAHSFTRRRRPGEDEIAAHLRGLGARLRVEAYGEDVERNAPREWLERTRDRIDSWSWEVPDAVFEACFPAYERWMHEHYGDLDRAYAQEVRYELEVWTFA